MDEYDSVFAIKDGFPVSENHHLIIPKRHSADYFTLTDKEKRDANRLIEILRKKNLKKINPSQGSISG